MDLVAEVEEEMEVVAVAVVVEEGEFSIFLKQYILYDY